MTSCDLQQHPERSPSSCISYFTYLYTLVSLKEITTFTCVTFLCGEKAQLFFFFLTPFILPWQHFCEDTCSNVWFMAPLLFCYAGKSPHAGVFSASSWSWSSIRGCAGLIGASFTLCSSSFKVAETLLLPGSYRLRVSH